MGVESKGRNDRMWGMREGESDVHSSHFLLGKTVLMEKGNYERAADLDLSNLRLSRNHLVT